MKQLIVSNPHLVKLVSESATTNLDRMTDWMDKAESGVEVANKRNNRLIGWKGFIIATVMMLIRVYSIELLLFAQNFGKLRVYVSVAKNYHNSFKLFQIALIRN
jgi:hypothetical protein